MKKILLLSLFSIVAFVSFSQDSTAKWSPSISIALEPVPVYSISGTDTSFVNSVAIAPFFSIRNKSGFGVSYSPKYATGGSSPSIFMHALTVGIEQYDKKIFNYTFNYSHYFFTNNGSIPYSPLNNEIFASTSYKAMWLVPSFSAGIGFGNNTEKTPSSFAYDIAASVGVSHGFNWKTSDVNYSLSPSLVLNGGTNEYYSLLGITKYIGRTKGFTKTVKNSVAAKAGSRGRRNGSSGSTSTTTTSTQTSEKFNINNFELGLESSIELGSFDIRPSANLYLPVGSANGASVLGYWSLTIEHSF